jgi:hypothetical protein
MSTQRSFVAEIAAKVGAYKRCTEKGNVWADKHLEWLELAAKELPSGSGIDRGTTIDIEASSDSRVVLLVSYHCMDENGYYCGWRDYKIVVTPSFQGFNLAVKGRDYNGLKEYLGELYHYHLGKLVEVSKEGLCFVE